MDIAKNITCKVAGRERDVILIQLDFVEVTFPRVDFTSCSVQGV